MFTCDRCGRPFDKGRSKSAHMAHCGRILRLRTLPGLVALRQELRRVARLEGRPDGVAPSLRGFRALGRVTDRRVQGAVGGYRAHNPILGWKETVRRLGFRPAATMRFAGERSWVMDDVYRVARVLGSPHHMPTRREYLVHGRWDVRTVLRYAESDTWSGVAGELHLTPNRAFPTARRAAA